ncbi:RAB6A-GEF complex partner protein 2 [Sarcoptes scabiei]|uniref:RAB6A-GEF complex partner protein 2 n=1 Tax=Sarcoptes scabiei TaxID=52283 RepID=A0A834VF45_SARSC|nr:RAB6A-GEF complex partner protein 2 [Sarcoptes scabiei]
MIEIQAKLLRGPVYFVNETLQCLITLRNVSNRSTNINDLLTDESSTNSIQKNGSNQSSDLVERICWANVQIHCFCNVDESQIDPNEIIEEEGPMKLNRFNSMNRGRSNNSNNLFKQKRNSLTNEIYSKNDTSFHESLIRGEKGLIIYSSKPKILFCDLQLESDQSQTFVYNETLPLNLNPSYSSNRVKYCYKLTIGTQRIGSAIYFLKIPIRILTIDGFSLQSIPCIPNGSNDLDEDIDLNESSLSPSSFMFDDESKDSSTILDMALHRIESMVSKRIPHTFNITNSSGKVAKFIIFKTVYRLGEEVIGLFDFSESVVKCIRYSVTLQSEEEITDRFLLKQNNSRKSIAKIQQNNHCHYQEYCLDLSHSPMNITIPYTVTPSFSNSLVTLRWNLHFSFIIHNDPTRTVRSLRMEHETEDGKLSLCQRQLDVQIMTWDLPIKIVATYPAHIAKGFQMASIGTLNI